MSKSRARAIDIHTHPMNKPFGGKGHEWYMRGILIYVTHCENATEEQVMESFPTDEEYVQVYREDNVKGLPISPAWAYRHLWNETDEAFVSGMRAANDYIAELVMKYHDVFPSGWAAVDPHHPHRMRLALEETERAVKGLGLIGLKFQQAAQEFQGNDTMYYPLWDLCQDLGCPIMVHWGYTGIGGMVPEGGGSGVLCMKWTNPLVWDEVARDFPKLKIIGAHPAEPYEEEACFICLHKTNVFRECSGWLPKYFPERMKREINTRLQDKVMWGTEGPGTGFPRPAKFIQAHEEFGWRDGVMEKILYKNVERILGIKNE